MSRLLTVVVPAYNMEKYLRRCLDSLCVEDVMDRVEIIVVNDGSKDDTLSIAQQYETKYPGYFKVIDKENGNYGSCMNRGLAIAKGMYFRTLDADDWYDKAAYTAFVDSLSHTDADMLLCERKVYYENTNETVLDSFPEDLVLNEDILFKEVQWSNKSLMLFQTVNCITYKTSLLKRMDMKWTESVFYSDTEYDYFPLNEIKTVRYMPYPVYCYYIGREDQSVSVSSVRKNFNSFYAVSKRILEDFIVSTNQDNPQYPIQKYHLIRILRFLYQSLLIDGLKNKKEIDDIEALVKHNEDLVLSTAKIDVYRNHYYVRQYRDNKMKYYLLRFDYMVRSNKLLRSLFNK